LFRSLEKNLSTTQHEIIVFIDSDNENTFDWLMSQKSIFPNLKILKNNLPICYGYARNINEMFAQASNDIVSYLQSDMVICKDYDTEIVKHLQPNMVLCSTRIEPPLHGSSNTTITSNFGLHPDEFDFDSFNEFASTNKQSKITEYFFAPFTLYKDVWLSIGGHDTLFRRSREDSDILTRLVLNNTKIIQVWNALVYHFTCTSSRGSDWFNKQNAEAQKRVQMQQDADRIELGRFIRKWGKFQHELVKTKKYHISAIIHGVESNPETLAYLDSYFDKFYVDDIKVISKVQTVYDEQHDIANSLLKISKEDWLMYSYMYNTKKASNVIFPISDTNDDVVVEFNINDIKSKDTENFIYQLQEIIDNTEDIGQFEYDIFKITINRKIDRASNSIVVTNPEIKREHLYTIH